VGGVRIDSFTFASTMAQKKLQRFAEILEFNNVLQYPEGMAGQWHNHFQNNHPITLELACGKGEYTVGLASLYPERNFIGVDVKGNRIWVGAKKCIQQQLGNAAFLRSQIGMIERYFSPGEVEEIWLPFPDPQLRISKAKKRLTHPVFLRKYKQFLKPGGYIHLKTDSPVLYQFTKRVIQRYGLDLFEDSDDIARELKQNRELGIKTHYEGLDIAGSKKIHYLKFTLNTDLDPKKDEQLAEETRQIEAPVINEERKQDEEKTNRG
jgi:tRNA (guanine-N7-)-methyltransferase